MNETDEALKKATEKLGEMEAVITANQEEIGKLQEENRGVAEKMEERRKISEEYAKKYVKLEDIQALHKEIDNIEKRFDTAKYMEDKAGVDNRKHTSALMEAISTPERNISTETREFFDSPEYRLLNETSDPSGGYLVTPEMDRTLIKYITQKDRMRSIARVQMANSDSMELDKETAILTAYWVNEQSPATESTPVIGEWDIKLHGLGVLTKATRNWLMDTYTNADAWISESAGTALGAKEAVAFVTGTGVGQPLGFLTGHGTDSDLYPADVSGKGSAVLSPLDFSELIGALKNEYWDTSTFVMNQNTLVDTMQLLQDSKFVWQPGLQGGFPSMILGRPFAIMISMEDISDGSYPIALGDFNKGYRILDRMGTLLVKDETSAAIFPKVAFNFLRRVGGRVVVPEAIKVLLVT